MGDSGIPQPDVSGLPIEAPQSELNLQNASQAMTPQPQAPPLQGTKSGIKDLLSGFLGGMGRSMMTHYGLDTPEEAQRKQQQQQMQQQNLQSEINLRSAQAEATRAGMVEHPYTLPDGTQIGIPSKYYPSIIKSQLTEQARREAANPIVTPEMAAAFGKPEWAGKAANTALLGIATRQNIAEESNQTRRDIATQGINTKLQIAQQSDAYKRWAAKLAADTKIRTANMTQTKAPAAMMQTAEFAQSGLNRLDDASEAFADLKRRGVLGGVTADKMENWIFGQGLIDPTLPPADRKEISTLRAALSYTSSAAMRAHTGRTSREIYDDFKTTMSLGQGADALEGAMVETRKMLGDYATSASDANIARIRGGGGQAPGTPKATHRFNPKTNKIEAIP